ncbi:iron ABC transporter [Psychrobacter sp. L7]|uniref:FecCD family ABC transporter permease n=1 Tax=Psychrobacter sp. L7 TaxID=1982756 RepID=UPI000C2ACF66|nr:iron chelate uptake ABC transporter family permease subunit [Psychrobacter sp. L7]PJX23439.1 iron ABC transporter [Psychrobacter sp. L7]
MVETKLSRSFSRPPKPSIAKRPITQALLWCGLFIILLIGCWQGLTAYSKFSLSLLDAFSLFAQSNAKTSLAAQLLIEIRLPRVLVAMIVGANLAVAGLLMQVMTRNSLASPAVLGINAGAACVVALSSIGLGFSFLTSTFLQALVGSVLSCALVAGLAGYFSGRPVHPVRLILSGVAINALLVGMTRAALITTDEQAYGVLYWLAGSIANTRWESIPMLALISLLALGYGWWLSPKLNVLVLGDEVASSLGVNLRALQWSCGALITILTAISVAVAGPIAFVGLIIPHVAKRLLRLVSNMAYEQLLPLCMLLGSILMVWADVLSRAIAYPAETPVGLLTALIGTPVFIALACRRRLDS